MFSALKRALPAVLVAAALAIPPAWAQGGRGTVLFDQTAPSAALGRDLAYSVYLPPGYPEPGRIYPVIYLFHGAGGDQRSWLRSRLPGILDGLIGGSQLQPVLVVAPAMERSFCVDSADIGGPGNFDTAFRSDLIAAIEQKYPVAKSRAGRAIAGNSMGGFCALHLGFEKPYAFNAVASMSGGFFGVTQAPRPLTGAFASVFGPGGMHSPRFEQANPLNEIRLARAGDLPDTYLTVGSLDKLGLAADSQQLYDAMKAERLPVQLRIDPEGGHDWPTWIAAAPEVFTFLGQHLRAAP